MSAAQPPRAFYRPELDGLRFLAFAAVFISHAFSQNPAVYERMGVPSGIAYVMARGVGSGGNGVLLFFVLSSYLITTLLLREHEREGSISLRDFYVRRSLRIFPLYFFFVFGVYLLIPQGSPAAIQSSFLPGYLLFLANWYFLVPTWVTTGGGVATLLWSVSVEEQFYFCWSLALRRFGVARVKGMALVMIGSGVLIRAVMAMSGASAVALWSNTFAWLDAIGAGALLAVLFYRKLPSLRTLSRSGAFLAGVALWVIGACLSDAGVSYTLLAPVNLIGAVLMFCAALGSKGFLGTAVPAYLGRISYGLYVYHLAALYVAEKLFPASIRTVAFAFALTVAASIVSYHLLEAPFLRLKERFTHVRSRPVEPAAIVTETA
jgi:peptidoglycan/LPS O-acetylase OafA/YrhL